MMFCVYTNWGASNIKCFLIVFPIKISVLSVIKFPPMLHASPYMSKWINEIDPILFPTMWFSYCVFPYAPISSWLNNVKPIFWLKETPILIFRKWASRYLHITACPARTDMYDFYVYIIVYIYVYLSLSRSPPITAGCIPDCISLDIYRERDASSSHLHILFLFSSIIGS